MTFKDKEKEIKKYLKTLSQELTCKVGSKAMQISISKYWVGNIYIDEDECLSVKVLNVSILVYSTKIIDYLEELGF